MSADKTLIKARLPRGFADRGAADIRATEQMVSAIRNVYERYGFEPVETPFAEYTETLGKFLPDQDRPNEGVFSLQDDDEQWVSLRYDLTAPLARYYAENHKALPRPFRSYRFGWVFRNEKPGPGRFRQFMQFDADTVGAATPAADAEMCMMAADALEALGVERGQYVIKVNSRKVLDGVMEAIGVTDPGQKLTVLRAIDKRDRLGWAGVEALLGAGRIDESGDATPGAGLDASQIDEIRFVMSSPSIDTERSFELSQDEPDDLADGGVIWQRTGKPIPIVNKVSVESARTRFPNSAIYQSGIDDLETISEALRVSGYGSRRVQVDFTVVRGLEYYTGAVYEAELLAEIPNEKGQKVIFGSVGGGGRYDGLVGRFQKENMPATGFSIGVSRLQAALAALGKLDTRPAPGPVVVTVMEPERMGDYQTMVTALRDVGIAAELYLGTTRNLGKQINYADKRNAPAVVIQGGDEKARGVVQIKDLALGKQLAEGITDNKEWREERPGQFEAPEAELVDRIREIVASAGANDSRNNPDDDGDRV